MNIIELINEKFPKLFITELTDNNLRFRPENDEGFIEYKRTLTHCDDSKIEQYATQMKWRIMQNLKKQRAIYYIGIDDNGTIVGLSQNDIIESVSCFVKIANIIGASIIGVRLIYIENLTIIKIGVIIKKIKDDFYFDVSDESD
ncbi:putative GTP-binding protein [Cotonvirus japonicus]|uniref:GTP-binding protein n=1 Tax=Cotonvirus japonicus TaxID=2811091 RepID=A0ABM7NTE3_9VIRU|nr:putative GTP-binding protein [Cotonvirus japonicus]BCS83448.1 putative GTP-binding protein [Cotonvirus japonicus]